MTDKQWERIIKESVILLKQAFAARERAEEEYKKRYGHYPSEVDDDFWIDLVHYGIGNVNIRDLEASAKSRII